MHDRPPVSGIRSRYQIRKNQKWRVVCIDAIDKNEVEELSRLYSVDEYQILNTLRIRSNASSDLLMYLNYFVDKNILTEKMRSFILSSFDTEFCEASMQRYLSEKEHHDQNLSKFFQLTW